MSTRPADAYSKVQGKLPQEHNSQERKSHNQETPDEPDHSAETVGQKVEAVADKVVKDFMHKETDLPNPHIEEIKGKGWFRLKIIMVLMIGLLSLVVKGGLVGLY